MPDTIENRRPSSSVRRWPLILIAAPAAVAIWSGWVGLGGMCGFGLVQPFPGIVSWHLDTSITLPVGVEAYGAYALGVWMRPSAIPEAARQFAKRSAIGALVLGMAGQVIFHLLSAAHRTRAPWPVVVLVACLPVVVLGFGAGLTHLLRADEPEPEAVAEPEPEPAEVPAPEPAPEAIEAVPVAAPEPVEDEPEADPVPVPADAEHAAEIAYRATVSAGNPLSGRQLETRFGITRGQATKVRQRVDSEPGRIRDAASDRCRSDESRWCPAPYAPGLATPCALSGRCLEPSPAGDAGIPEPETASA